MAKLIRSMLTSLDGYSEDEHGQFGWGFSEDASVHCSGGNSKSASRPEFGT